MNTNKRKTLLATFVALFAAGATTQGAMAQTESATEQSKIDEIVVTATKRSTSLQDTALSVSAISGADLSKLGVTSFNQIMSTVPGVTLVEGGAGNNSLTFRGVATAPSQGGANATTSTYIDEFPLALKDIDIKLVDMQQIEVLKGPQGTLYGQSAMGGVMRYITNKPNYEEMKGGFDVSASNVAEGDSGYQGQGYINIPLSDNFAIRAVFYEQDNPGFIDNLGTGTKDVNSEEVTGGRLALRWGISERAEFNLLYLNQTQRAGSGQALGFNTITSRYTPVDNGNPTDIVPPNFSDLSYRSNINAFQDKDFEVLNLKLDVAFDHFDLSVLAATKERQTFFQWDASPWFGVYDDVTTIFLQDDFEFDTNTLEIRLVSSDNGPLEWIAGIWYEKEDGNHTVANEVQTSRADLTLFGVPFADGDVIRNSAEFDDTEELAVYGEVGYRFAKKAKLTLGYRRANLKLDSGFLSAAGRFGSGNAALIGVDESAQEDINTYKIHFEYAVNDDILAYALASSGYRAGGFNRGGIFTAASIYESDALWNYEVGARTSWLDSRLTANIVAYYIDWSDIQLRTFDSDSLAQRIQNVAKAEIYGLESEIRYQATDSLQLSLNYAYTDASLSEDFLDTSTDPATVLAADGSTLPGSSKDTLSLFADWTSSLTSDLDLQANISYVYLSSRPNALVNTGLVGGFPDTPSSERVNLSVGVAHKNGVTASLFANNLLDERNIQAEGSFGPARLEIIGIDRPRVIGIRAGYKF